MSFEKSKVKSQITENSESTSSFCQATNETSAQDFSDMLKQGIDATVSYDVSNKLNDLAVKTISTSERNKPIAHVLVAWAKESECQGKRKAIELNDCIKNHLKPKKTDCGQNIAITKKDKKKQKLQELEKEAMTAGKLVNRFKTSFNVPKDFIRKKRIKSGLKTIYKKKKKEVQQDMKLAEYSSKIRDMDKLRNQELDIIYSSSSSDEESNTSGDGFDADLELTQLRLKQLPLVENTTGL